MALKPKVEKILHPEPPQVTLPPEAPMEKELTLLEKAKLIADLAAVWENKELSTLLTKLPNGAKVIEVFQEAISREMNAIMSGRQNDKDEQATGVLSGKLEQMAAAIGAFHSAIKACHESPLVQVLEVMNKNLGYRGGMPQAPAHVPQQPVNPGYSPAAQAGLAAANPQTGPTFPDDQGSQPGRRSRQPGLGSP